MHLEHCYSKVTNFSFPLMSRAVNFTSNANHVSKEGARQAKTESLIGSQSQLFA